MGDPKLLVTYNFFENILTTTLDILWKLKIFTEFQLLELWLKYDSSKKFFKNLKKKYLGELKNYLFKNPSQANFEKFIYLEIGLLLLVKMMLIK